MRYSEARNPRVINFLAYVLWSFPVTYIPLMGTFYNLDLDKMFWLYFTGAYVVHSSLAVFTGFALYRMRPYAWHFYVLHSVLMLAEQFQIGLRYGHSKIVAVPLAFTSAAILGALYVLKTELRVPYFSPKIAWWEADPRYKISVPTQLTCADHYYRGDIMDISATGCFVKTKDPLKVDQTVHIKFSLFDHRFECEGRVVWRTESGVTHPKGVGIRFLGLEKKAHNELRDTVKKLKTLSRKYKDLRAEEKAVTMERKVQALISQRKG